MRDPLTITLEDGLTVAMKPTRGGYTARMSGKVVVFKRRKGGWYALVQGDGDGRNALESKTLLGGIYRAVDRLKEVAG